MFFLGKHIRRAGVYDKNYNSFDMLFLSKKVKENVKPLIVDSDKYKEFQADLKNIHTSLSQDYYFKSI